MIPQCKRSNFNDASLKLKSTIEIHFNPKVGKNHDGWNGCFYYKVGTRVTVHIGANLGTTTRSLIYTLPEGFRPAGAISTFGGGADGNVPDNSFIELYPSGDIWIKAPSKFALITVEYDAFN